MVMSRARRSMNTVFEESGENALDSTGGSGNILDRENENPAARSNKRYRLFRELLETEENYVEVLKTIINNFQIPLEDARLADIESRVQRKIFGRFEPLFRIHSYILSSLQQLDKQWTHKTLVGQIYATRKQDLLDNYVPYINNYEQIKETVDELKKVYPLFNEFIQRCEMNGDGKRYKLSDLLIRPVQRLPSVMLLHSELIKATEKKSHNNPDIPWLRAAHETIQYVLSMSNEKRTESEQYDKTMHWINQIERFPPVLVSQRRLFQEKADFHILKANGMFTRHKGCDVTFFLFNDCVTVAKNRDYCAEPQYGTPERRNSTLSLSLSHGPNLTLPRYPSMTGTLQRSNSILNFVKPSTRKPFNHLELLRFPDFRSLMYLEEEGIFFVKIRDVQAEEYNAFQIAGDTTIDRACDFFRKLCEFVNETCRHELKLEEVNNLIESNGIGEEDQMFVHKAKVAASKIKDGSIRRQSKIFEMFIAPILR
ncbi:Protein ECT2 [Aphelenchoides besseyi]|nr:Protein ECT2 [Aphelenchoides besseyi]